MREWKLAEYRADRWRAFVLVVALSCAVASASTVVREFRAAGIQNRDRSAIQPLSYTVSHMGGLIEATSRLIEHTRRAE